MCGGTLALLCWTAMSQLRPLCRCWVDSSLQGFLVEHVLAKARAHTFEVGDVIAKLLDRLDLFLKELALQEVSHLSKTKTKKLQIKTDFVKNSKARCHD